jgi:hypothetical protein
MFKLNHPVNTSFIKVFLLLSIFSSFLSFGQRDTIFLTNNSRIVPDSISYVFPNVEYYMKDPAGKKPKKTLLTKGNILLIARANKTYKFYSILKGGPIYNPSDFRKGSLDAFKFYKHSGGSVGTAIATFATGGILGLIPAIGCSATTPKEHNLGLPRDAPIENIDYMLGYVSQAKRIKRKKVWRGYGFGVLGVVIVGIFLSSTS